MIGKDEIAGIIEDYDRLKLRVGMTASHSALDICDGAIEEGFPTVAYCQKGREKTYSEYFKTQRTVSGRVRRGMVDKAIVMDSFNDVMNPAMQDEMRKGMLSIFQTVPLHHTQALTMWRITSTSLCLVHATC